MVATLVGSGQLSMLNTEAFNNGGGIEAYAEYLATFRFENSIFRNNGGGLVGGGPWTHVVVENSTICDNSGTGVRIFAGSTASIHNSIVSGNTGYGVENYDTAASISYSDVWNNSSGNYFGCEPGVGCISDNPIFCDTASDNYYLSNLSLCVGAGEGGADIGAFGAGCGMELTPGPNLAGPAQTDVAVEFYLRNFSFLSDTYNLNIVDSLGWTIVPTYYQVLIDSGEVDTVRFTVSIPSVPVGTIDRLRLTALSQTDPSVADTADLFVTCGSYNIAIRRISDVGNDQGKQVRIDWTSFPGDDPLVRDFTIFIRIDTLLFASLGFNQKTFTLLDYPPGRWAMVGTYPAFGETLYSAFVPTLKDSTKSEGMYWSYFFIRAGTDNPTVYFDSPVDSGYSLDNLSPSPPAGLLASHKPAVTKLTWRNIGDFDFKYYTLYRDTTSEFQPSPNNRLSYTIDTSFTDSTAQLGRAYFYLVSATDFSGNESNPSNEAIGIRYITGDANTDGAVSVSDIVYLINYLFKGGASPKPLASANVNCDGKVSVSDVIYLINYLFKGGPPPCEP
jgi:hypothetical protein